MAGEAPTIREPAPLKGPCEKKGAFKLASSSWASAHVEVRTPGFLYIFKDQRNADATPSQHTLSGHLNSTAAASAAGLVILDLRLVLDFRVVENRRGKEEVELDIETVEDTIKLRFKSAEEAELWRKGLLDWKDYCVDYTTMFAGTGARGDVEQGMSTNRSTTGGRPSEGLIRDSASSGAGRPSASASTPFNLDDIHVSQLVKRSCCVPWYFFAQEHLCMRLYVLR